MFVPSLGLARALLVCNRRDQAALITQLRNTGDTVGNKLNMITKTALSPHVDPIDGANACLGASGADRGERKCETAAVISPLFLFWEGCQVRWHGTT